MWVLGGFFLGGFTKKPTRFFGYVPGRLNPGHGGLLTPKILTWGQKLYTELMKINVSCYMIKLDCWHWPHSSCRKTVQNRADTHFKLHHHTKAITCPGKTRSDIRRFSVFRTEVVVPKCAAMPARVSVFWTWKQRKYSYKKDAQNYADNRHH